MIFVPAHVKDTNKLFTSFFKKKKDERNNSMVHVHQAIISD